jgi:hypothetical protein
MTRIELQFSWQLLQDVICVNEVIRLAIGEKAVRRILQDVALPQMLRRHIGLKFLAGNLNHFGREIEPVKLAVWTKPATASPSPHHVKPDASAAATFEHCAYSFTCRSIRRTIHAGNEELDRNGVMA